MEGWHPLQRGILDPPPCIRQTKLKSKLKRKE